MKTNNEVPMPPKNYLDHREKLLAAKHHRRLQQITRESLQKEKKIWHSAWLKPVLASAFSVFLIVNIISYNKNDKPNTLNTNLPQWVTDTDVPLTLIENLDFYDWLAKQKNDKTTKKKALTRMVFNEFSEYYIGKRFAANDFTERFPRTITNFGAIQR